MQECGQQNPDHHINDCQFQFKCANCGGDHPVYARSCESWRQEKEVLTIKHQSNIPYDEARKLVVGFKTTTYSQVVQRNKSSYKYETGDWENFIHKIRVSLDTTRVADASTTSVNLAENKEESSAQTQNRMEKTDIAEKTAKTPTTRPIKHCNKI